MQLQGSRQIGKTTELLKFAYSNYENIIYVDMTDDTYEFNRISKSVYIDIFMSRYCIRANMAKFENTNSTIIIIDEIQLSV